MRGLVEFAAEGVRALRRIKSKKWSFLAFFVLILATSVLFLGWLDLLPNGPAAKPQVAQLAATTTPAVVAHPEEVVKIEASTIGLSATVANPTTTNVEALDALLLKGAVRYPTSAKLGEDGNVVLFGHSSYLPIVGNHAYKTFNDIQKLKQGDLITVYSSTNAYTYAVRSVAKENASDGAIPLTVSGKVLTLATCNSFGQKSDRFVVTADLVESHPIGA